MDVGTTKAQRAVPRWVAWTLIVGSVLLFLFAWFIYGFLSEPSAVGRSRVVLDWLIGSSVGAGVAGLVSAFGVLRRTRWAWATGVFASAVMIATCAGAVIGIPALIGLISTRRSS